MWVLVLLRCLSNIFSNGYKVCAINLDVAYFPKSWKYQNDALFTGDVIMTSKFSISDPFWAKYQHLHNFDSFDTTFHGNFIHKPTETCLETQWKHFWSTNVMQLWRVTLYRRRRQISSFYHFWTKYYLLRYFDPFDNTFVCNFTLYTQGTMCRDIVKAFLTLFWFSVTKSLKHTKKIDSFTAISPSKF